MNHKMAKWICPSCKKEEIVEDPAQVDAIERSYEVLTKECKDCGGDMHAISAAEEAALKGLYWCVAKEDFVRTDSCPDPACDAIARCHRHSFFR
jgi:hypothetical protein